MLPLLDVRGLTVRFASRRGAFVAVDGIDLQVHGGEVLGIVGESGSGKSVAMLAVMGLLPWTATVEAERMVFDGHDLRALSARERRALVGRDMAMVFQEPMTSLNPCFTVGWQIGEALTTHLGLQGAARRSRVLELLQQVGIPDPDRRAKAFPHQLSGGMSQRVMIAMALACRPRLLIADEPTTALDVTIQAQILELLLALQRDTGMALVLITHDLGVVAETAHRVVVQYAGVQVEANQADALFTQPHHPYTAALLQALPGQAGRGALAAIGGVVPGQFDVLQGCRFAPRCTRADAICHSTVPPLQGDGQAWVRCHHPLASPMHTAEQASVAAGAHAAGATR